MANKIPKSISQNNENTKIVGNSPANIWQKSVFSCYQSPEMFYSAPNTANYEIQIHGMYPNVEQAVAIYTRIYEQQINRS